MKIITIALAFFTLTGCSSLLYQPARHQIYDPEKFGLKYDNVYFQSTDGTRLHGWHFKNTSEEKKPKALIVFFHGNGENLSTHFATLAWILAYGYDYMIFDYRGYGQSEGQSTPEGTVQDGIAAIRHSSQLAKGVPLIVFAQSLGGAVALRSLIELKREIPIRLAVIDSSFLSYRAAGRSVLSHHWISWPFQPLTYLVLSDSWAPGDQVSQISPTPLLVIHGTADQIVDYDLGEDLYEKASAPKEFWRISEGRHTDVFWHHKNKYRMLFLEKLKKVLN